MYISFCDLLRWGEPKNDWTQAGSVNRSAMRERKKKWLLLIVHFFIGALYWTLYTIFEYEKLLYRRVGLQTH